MLSHIKPIIKISRMIIIIITFGLILFSVGLVSAVLFDVSTTDNVVTDWDPITVFRTDPAGDSVDGRNDEDIINSWAASGPAAGPSTTMFFHVQTAASVESLTQSGRAVAAALDCDRDGNFEEKGDRKIVYLQNMDVLYIYQGDRSSFSQPTSPFPNSEMGQEWDTTGPIDHLEWKVAFSHLPPTTLAADDPPGANCQGQVDIMFVTFQFNPLPPNNFIKDLDTVSPRGFDVPTDVDLTRFSASRSDDNRNLVGFITLIGVSTLICGVWLLRRHKA